MTIKGISYKAFLIFLILLIGKITNAQNLVPNHSFEENYDVKCGWTGYKHEIERMIPPWTMPTNGTPDVFYLDIEEGCQNHPLSKNLNRKGQIFPKDGLAMAGIYTFYFCPICSENVQDYKEYLQVPLLKNLQKRERYIAGMWVSFANRSRFASNNIGMAFSTMDIDLEIISSILLTPKVNKKEILINPGEWERVWGVFTADSTYNYLIIGNFFHFTNTNTQEIHYDDYNPRLWAYYYIDDIFVEPFPVPDIPNIFTPNGDEFNERFEISNIKLGEWSLRVYNRYGQMVYNSPAYMNDWDGNGLSNGVYYYILKHSFVEGEEYKGWVQILR
jgi:gliding motility-associated-like protein